MNTLDLLTEISGSKLATKTDKQLAHFEKLEIYRNSQKNKEHFAALGQKQQKYTMEQIQHIRLMFWEEGKSVQDCLNYLDTTNGNSVKKYLMNKRYVDPNFEWDATEYAQRAENQRRYYHPPFIFTERHKDIVDGMDMKSWTTKWESTKNAWTTQRSFLKKKGYTIVGMRPSPKKTLS